MNNLLVNGLFTLISHIFNFYMYSKECDTLSSYKIFHIQRTMYCKYVSCPLSGHLSAVQKVFVSLTLLYQKSKYISTNCTIFNT